MIPDLTAIFGHGYDTDFNYRDRHLSSEDLFAIQQELLIGLRSGAMQLDLPTLLGTHGTDPADKAVAEEAVPEEVQTMTMGSATPEMVDLLQNAMIDVPIISLTIPDLPFRSAYVHLEQPLFVPQEETATGAVLLRAVRGMAWMSLSGPGHPSPALELVDHERHDEHATAVALFLFTDPREPVVADDPSIEAVNSEQFMRNLAHNESMSMFQRLGEVVCHWHVATFIDLPASEVRSRHPEGFIWIIQAFHALWALMNQEVPIIEPQRVNRQAYRQGQRSGVTPNIITIRLRREFRPSDPDAPKADRHYSHRFLVSGHWRHYRDASGEVVKRTWIRPYVKGPEDASLVVKRRRFNLAR